MCKGRQTVWNGLDGRQVCLYQLAIVLFFSSTAVSHAHTPDTSYASVEFTLSTLRIEFRYDLESLTRLAKIDANQDGLIFEVEIGQLVIVACLWPIWKLVSNTKRGPLISRCLSCAILACGTAWLLDRLLGLEWMPF